MSTLVSKIKFQLKFLLLFTSSSVGSSAGSGCERIEWALNWCLEYWSVGKPDVVIREIIDTLKIIVVYLHICRLWNGGCRRRYRTRRWNWMTTWVQIRVLFCSIDNRDVVPSAHDRSDCHRILATTAPTGVRTHLKQWLIRTKVLFFLNTRWLNQRHGSARSVLFFRWGQVRRSHEIQMWCRIRWTNCGFRLRCRCLRVLCVMLSRMTRLLFRCICLLCLLWGSLIGFGRGRDLNTDLVFLLFCIGSGVETLGEHLIEWKWSLW
jgi:hypothetical protein